MKAFQEELSSVVLYGPLCPLIYTICILDQVWEKQMADLMEINMCQFTNSWETCTFFPLPLQSPSLSHRDYSRQLLLVTVIYIKKRNVFCTWELVCNSAYTISDSTD